MTQIRNTNIHSGVELGGGMENATLILPSSTDYTITTSDIEDIGILFVVCSTYSDDMEVTLPTCAQMGDMLITLWHETAWFDYRHTLTITGSHSSGNHTSVKRDDWITIFSDGDTYQKLGNVMTVPPP